MAERAQRNDDFGLRDLIDSGLIPREELEESARRRFKRWESGADAAMDVLWEQMTGAMIVKVTQYGEEHEIPDNTSRRQAALEWLKRVPGAEQRRAKPVETNESPRELVIRMESLGGSES